MSVRCAIISVHSSAPPRFLQFNRDCHHSGNSIEEMMPVGGANRSMPCSMGLPANHEQVYAQSMLKTGGMQRRNPSEIGTGYLGKAKQVRVIFPENGKGCDIGYVPAACSCERACSVDPCTVAALDAITAFAVPNPNCSSQKQSVFSGLVAPQVALLSRSLSLLRTDKFYFANPFSRRRRTN
jgi:hypothetical protein